MVKLLSLKMFRDMKRAAVTYGVCILILAIGFCGYSVISLSYDNLEESKNLFFQTTDFPHVFAEVQEAPLSVSGKLEQVEGVKRAEGRLVELVQVKGYEEEVELQLVSILPEGMNLPMLSQGILPNAGTRELVIGNKIAKARDMKVGEELNVVITGDSVNLKITGFGLTPENIYMIKDMGELLPDSSKYDVGFLPYQTMTKLFAKEGKVNGFLVMLEPGVQLESVKSQLEQILEPYGCYRIYDRSDQLSVSMLEAELDQLDKMTEVVPFLFLLVAAVILYITLSRLVEQQRIQIGTLLAMGIPSSKVQLHYLGYGAFTGFVGGLLGGILGYWCAGPMGDFYRIYFSLPKVRTSVSWSQMLVGVLCSVLFCALTAWSCAGNLLKLSPAKALRPAAPKTTKVSFLERIPKLTELFTVPGVMAIRSIARNRKRAALSLTGIAFAFMITATLVSMNALFDVFLFDFWEKTQQQDIMVQFSRPVHSEDALRAVRHPEIQLVEGVMEFPVTLSGPEGQMQCNIQAIAPDSQLCRLFEEDGSRVFVEKEGVVLSKHMANVIGVDCGSIIEIEVAYPEKKKSRVVVTGVIAQYMGGTAYMSYHGAESISQYRDTYSSILLKAPESVQGQIKSRLEEASAVSVVESREERLEKYHIMMGSMSSMMAGMAFLGVGIGFSVIYVSSLISFEELSRELSILMMLGLSGRQCLDVISTSQWILAAGGILLGIPMTMGVSKLMSVSMTTELYSIPDFVDGFSLLSAVLLTFLSVWFSSYAMLHKINRISPVDLLRERE